MLRHGLLDELRLWIHPLFVGTGGLTGLIFREGTSARFRLADTKILKNGHIVASYQTQA